MAEIHLGDVGTLYRLRISDDGVPFDPSTAQVKRLKFTLPGGSVIEKDAEVEEEGSPATSWYLTYRVQANDGIGSPPGEFHGVVGRIWVQGYLRWEDGSQFHTDRNGSDERGRVLKVHRVMQTSEGVE